MKKKNKNKGITWKDKKLYSVKEDQGLELLLSKRQERSMKTEQAAVNTRNRKLHLPPLTSLRQLPNAGLKCGFSPNGKQSESGILINYHRFNEMPSRRNAIMQSMDMFTKYPSTMTQKILFGIGVNEDGTLISPMMVKNRGELYRSSYVYEDSDWRPRPQKQILPALSTNFPTSSRPTRDFLKERMLAGEEARKRGMTERPCRIQQRITALLLECKRKALRESKLKALVRKHIIKTYQKRVAEEKANAVKHDTFLMKSRLELNPQPRRVIKAIKAALNPALVMPLGICVPERTDIEPEFIHEDKPVIVKLESHLRKKQSIRINDFILDFAKKIESIAEKTEDVKTSPVIQKKQEIILLLPKAFSFGDIEPRSISSSEYTENFSCFKIDPAKIIEFLNQNLKGEEISLSKLKNILKYLSLPVLNDVEREKILNMMKNDMERQRKLLEQKETARNEKMKGREERERRKNERLQEMGRSMEEQNAKYLEREQKKAQRRREKEREKLAKENQAKLNRQKRKEFRDLTEKECIEKFIRKNLMRTLIREVFKVCEPQLEQEISKEIEDSLDSSNNEPMASRFHTHHSPSNSKHIRENSHSQEPNMETSQEQSLQNSQRQSRKHSAMKKSQRESPMPFATSEEEITSNNVLEKPALRNVGKSSKKIEHSQQSSISIEKKEEESASEMENSDAIITNDALQIEKGDAHRIKINDDPNIKQGDTLKTEKEMVLQENSDIEENSCSSEEQHEIESTEKIPELQAPGESVQRKKKRRHKKAAEIPPKAKPPELFYKGINILSDPKAFLKLKQEEQEAVKQMLIEKMEEEKILPPAVEAESEISKPDNNLPQTGGYSINMEEMIKKYTEELKKKKIGVVYVKIKKYYY